MRIKGSHYVDLEIHRRFDSRKTVFCRQGIFEGFDHFQPETDDPGDTELLGLAEARASWTLHDNYPGAFRETSIGKRPLVLNRKPFQFRFSDPIAATDNIIEVAKRFGASLAGITELETRWLYSNDRTGAPVTLPDEARWVIVLAVEMDRDSIATSPSFRAAAASGKGYSDSAALAGAVGEYLRLLGCYARSCGNDTALSIPLAIDAGMGVLGRNGLLLTPEFGPGIRLCKVITDLELASTHSEYPTTEDVCSGCTLCAEACEADALSTAEKPTWEVLTESNNPGVIRWQFNPEKCFDFWLKIGRDCSNCISACPAAGRLQKMISEKK